MRVALLSHRIGNIGHAFMAIGMEEILKRAFPGDLSITHFEQHAPFCIYPCFHPLALLEHLPNGVVKKRLRTFLSSDACRRFFWPTAKRLPFDIAIACGGPNIIPDAGKLPMMRLIFHHQLGAFRYRGVPVVDAAVGSCFPLERIPERIEDPVDRAYFQQEFRYCRALTVRDALAKKVWTELGARPHLLPCAAITSGIFFQRECPKRPGEGDYILINFQEKGSNTDWKQNVDTVLWRQTVLEVIRVLRSQGHDVRMLCHNQKETDLAAGFGVPVFSPRTPQEYGHAIANASVAFVSRLHAAIPLAGIGVASLLVGTDTRIFSLDQMGLPVLPVKEATPERIIACLTDLLQRRESERVRLLALRDTTAHRYGIVFKSVLKHP